MYLSLYCKGSKRVTQGFTMRGSWRPNRTAIFWPPLLWPSALCLSRSPGLLNQRPRGPALCWMMAFFTTSYHQLLSKTPSGSRGPLRPGVAFPTTSCRQLLWTPTHQGLQGPLPPGMAFPTTSRLYNSNCLISVLTELYNSSTPTQSLEWHVWLSSSGNNCYAVHRSLSSSASLWSGTFTLSHIISWAHLRDFLS